MKKTVFEQRDIRTYLVLVSLVMCGLAASIVTAPKIVHIGVNFPFSNLIFSIFTYPIIDCICELWGKKVARQTLWLALLCQVLIMALIQLSIVTPPAAFWTLQTQYHTVLATGLEVVVASLLAFSASQVLDITVYQRIKELSRGRWLWLRSNVSIYLGQALDSLIFVSIVFAGSPHKWAIIGSSILVKVILSFAMTPVIYLIVIGANRYLQSETLAFKQ